MSELGFGLVDRRTVVVVLMTLILTHALMGFSVPIDTTSVLSLLISLIFFTAYMYMARTVLRIPFILYPAIKASRDYRPMLGEPTLRERLLKLVEEIAGKGVWSGSWGIVDRAGLIVVVILATIPIVGQTIVEAIGSAGLFFMLLIYVIRGHFSFAVEDALKKSEDDQRQLLLDTQPRIPSFPSVIETKPYSNWDP